MLHFYDSDDIKDHDFSRALVQQLDYSPHLGIPYVVSCDENLAAKFSEGFLRGATLTNCGFYGPQGRVLRLGLQDPDLNDKIAAFSYNGRRITNLEMETAGMYGLAKLMGHRSVSLNAIIANRATGQFTRDSKATVDQLIRKTLDILALNN